MIILTYNQKYHQKNKASRNAYSRLYRKNNKEKLKENNKRYNLENRDKRNAYSKKYHRKKRKKCLELQKEWKTKNKDRCLIYFKKYRNKNRYRFKMYKHNRRVLMKNAGKLTIETIQRVYEDNIKKYGTLTCYLCLKPILFGDDHLEHKIPLTKGGTNEKKNLAPACPHCNNSKYNKTEKEYKKYRKELKYYARTRAITSSP